MLVKKNKGKKEEMMTEPMGYCADYIVMRFENDCVHNEDHYSKIPTKDVMPLMTPELSLPLVVERGDA